jgi:hypothetical protein
MTDSITYSDLQQYGNLREHLKDLYIKITNGKREVQDGVDDFEVYYDKLFPKSSTITTAYADADKLSYTTKGTTAMGANAISLKKLLHNTLYPVFYQTKNNGPTSYTTISNSHIAASGTGKKDHLCFIKLNTDDTNIEPDEYSITNILYSKYAIEIFIRIIRALNYCYNNQEKDLISLFSSSTPIFIVAKKLKSTDNDDPRGIFINNATNDADSPPIGIYLYIGNIANMFSAVDIKLYESNSANYASDAERNTYLAATTNIFTGSNKLHYTVSGKYYFGFLHYYNYRDNELVYQEQTGSSTTYKKNNIPGTMTKMTMKEAKISSGNITGAAITKLKILKGSTITKVPSTTNTYTATGNISGIIQGGCSLATGATIATESIQNVTMSADSDFTSTASTGETETFPTTIIRPKTIPRTSGTTIISDSISLTSTYVTNLQFTTDAEIIFTGNTFTLPNNQDAYDVTGQAIDIKEVIISAPNVAIIGTFDKLNSSTTAQTSYYKQNIYYIYNFLKMINNIDNNSFSTTLQYLEVNLLCFKSLLLSSIRAANIFYNNRHKISALAISYEENFLDNAADTAGSSDICAKLALNDFIKNGYTAKFGTCADATGIKLQEDTTATGKVYQYILYKRNTTTSSPSADNDTIFKDYDVRIQQEINRIKNSNITGSTTNLGIDNFQLCHSFKVLSPFKISTYNDNTNDTLEQDGILKNSGSDSDYLTIIKMFEYNKKHDFNKNYRIKIVGTTFKAISFNIIPDATNKRRIVIELEQSNDIPPNLLNKLNKSSGATQITENVYIVKITSGDIDKDYNNIVSNTDTVEQNINMYKTKIKNNTTLYELHKSRNNLLYNQVMSYLIIVGVLIAILVIINIANVEKPLIKSITLGCLAVIIILFMSYYIMNTLYIEEGFTGSDNSFIGYDLCPAGCKVSSASLEPGKKNEYDTDIITNKKNYVKNFLDTNAKELMLMIILKSPSIVNDSLKGNNEKLVTISKNIYNEKLYLNDVLYSKKSDSEMNVDVLKYENKNYDVYIVCILFLALIMVGSYTVNIYTDNKYMDLLILIMVILFVCLFTYFVLYTNRIVRTVSTNYYWGNQYENEYI